MLCEIQPISSRIWTRVAVYISRDDNHYTTGTLFRYKTTSLVLISVCACVYAWLYISVLVFSQYTYIIIFALIYIQLWLKLWSTNEKLKLWFKLIYLKVKNSGVNINNNNRYLVCPPFAFITAFIRFCIILTKLLQVVGSIFCLSSWSLASIFFFMNICAFSLFFLNGTTKF